MLKKISAIVAIVMVFAGITSIGATTIDLQSKPQLPVSEGVAEVTKYKKIDPLQLVATPSKYIDKTIKFNAKFDKFATIGLDYPPANRPIKDYISFLIKRENVVNYNIPLSELKLILKRDYAEKELVNLETGDEIEVYGKVFCLALGDPWVDVEKVVILTPKENNDKENKDSEGK